MAVKTFCDVCQGEVKDYLMDSWGRLGGYDVKVTVSVQSEEEIDLCHTCFWDAVNSIKGPSKKGRKRVTQSAREDDPG